MMKEIGVYIAGLMLLMALAAHLYITTTALEHLDTPMALASNQSNWPPNLPDSAVDRMINPNQNHRIFDMDELDVIPLINDQCKGDTWKWDCTKEEFNQYVESELWSRMPHAEEPLQWHEMIEVVVDERGRITQVHTVLSKNDPCEVCYETLTEVILNMPRWIPGVKDGRSVKTRLVIPFSSFSFS